MDKTYITDYEWIKLGISDRAIALMRTTIKKRPVVCGIITADGGDFCVSECKGLSNAEILFMCRQHAINALND